MLAVDIPLLFKRTKSRSSNFASCRPLHNVVVGSHKQKAEELHIHGLDEFLRVLKSKTGRCCKVSVEDKRDKELMNDCCVVTSGTSTLAEWLESAAILVPGQESKSPRSNFSASLYVLESKIVIQESSRGAHQVGPNPTDVLFELADISIKIEI